MDISVPSKVGVWGVPFCIYVTSPYGAPTIAIAAGATAPTVTLLPSGSYEVCVTPDPGATTMALVVLSGPSLRGMFVSLKP